MLLWCGLVLLKFDLYEYADTLLCEVLAYLEYLRIEDKLR